MSFKLWLESAGNGNLSEKIEAIGKIYVNGYEHEKHRDFANKDLVKVLDLLKKAEDSYITPDEYKFIKSKVGDYMSPKIIDSDNKLLNYLKIVQEKAFNSLSQEEKEKYDYRVTDPLQLLLGEIIYSFGSFAKNKKLLMKKANVVLVKTLPPDLQAILQKYLEESDNLLAIKTELDNLKDKVKNANQIKMEKQQNKEAELRRLLELKPMVSIEAVQKLTAKVEEFLNSLKEKYISSNKATLKKRAEDFVARNTGIPIDENKFRDLVYESRNLSIEGLIYHQFRKSPELLEDFEDRLERRVNGEWDGIYKFFRERMIGKLGPLVDAKAEQTESGDFEFEMIRSSIYYGTVECKFNMKFTDNSSFSVTHQTVLSTSILGKYFYRFPTTFSNINLADGTHFNALSENELYKRFANIEKPKEE
jgi:hypothetical protein